MPQEEEGGEKKKPSRCLLVTELLPLLEIRDEGNV